MFYKSLIMSYCHVVSLRGPVVCTANFPKFRCRVCEIRRNSAALLCRLGLGHYYVLHGV